MILNYTDHLIILASTKFTGFVSIFDFASLVVIPVVITSSVMIIIEIFVINAGIKKYKSITEKNKN